MAHELHCAARAGGIAGGSDCDPVSGSFDCPGDEVCQLDTDGWIPYCAAPTPALADCDNSVSGCSCFATCVEGTVCGLLPSGFYVCLPTEDSMLRACTRETEDDVCIFGEYCDGDFCVLQKPIGASCARDDECFPNPGDVTCEGGACLPAGGLPGDACGGFDCALGLDCIADPDDDGRWICWPGCVVDADCPPTYECFFGGGIDGYCEPPR